MQLTIPDAVIQSIRLPESRVEPELLKELAIALYAQEMLPFGKAVELANIDGEAFSQLVGARGMNRRCRRVEADGQAVYVCSD
ncbi:MAG: UPF0175 family protein [Kaiparowitsia implicata GSE-PSE-MK54-09C]|jgi:predicted HTH domain antitoxin|nr:UPF0175 family protein [Kaiparowitsia implicata GSE-PSE-MK54-09C]